MKRFLTRRATYVNITVLSVAALSLLTLLQLAGPVFRRSAAPPRTSMVSAVPGSIFPSVEGPFTGAPQKVAAAYGRLPIAFEPNQGQLPGTVNFLARTNGFGMLLSAGESTLLLRQRSDDARPRTTALRMKLEGANATAAAVGERELPGRTNYLLGNDPAQWRTEIANYERVRFAQVYRGVDLTYYGNNREVEYDFTVAPGADPDQIALQFPNAEALRVDEPTGDLLIETEAGAVRQKRPVVYQDINGTRQAVAAAYELRGERKVHFALGEYDRSRELIIDPVLVYGTYLGGADNDTGYAIAVDAAGNAYVTGSTFSTNFPTTAGALKTVLAPNSSNVLWGDAFVTKLNPNGTAFVYSTFYGGLNGSEIGTGIAVDDQGNAYLTGTTTSPDLPTVNAAQGTKGAADDVFVAKLNPAGSALIYSTFLGGNNSDLGGRIAVDPQTGEAIVGGAEISPNFPTTPGAFRSAPCPGPSCVTFVSDAYVAKYNAVGGVQFVTVLGGDAGMGGPVNGIALDSGGNIFVAGSAAGNKFPATPGAFQTVNSGGTDAFVAKMNSSGTALIYGTYLGGGLQSDRANAIAIDAAGNAYVTGQTESIPFPTTPGAFDNSFNGGEDTFVTKLNSTGTALVFSTFLGGTAADRGRGITVDATGNVYVASETTGDFPLLHSLQQVAGATNIALTEFDPAGSALVFSTYLGAGGPKDLRMDASRNAYLTGEGVTIPVTPGVVQPTRPSPTKKDGFVLKIGPADETTQTFSISGTIDDLNPSEPTNTGSTTVTLSGAQNRSIEVSMFGNRQYFFGNLPAGGDYTVTATKAGFVLQPPSQGFPGLAANQTANFTVQVNQAPTATMTSPVHGATFTSPGAIHLAANATDPDGTISKIEYKAYSSATGVITLGTSTTAPFSFDWTTAPAGVFSLSAIPYDNLGRPGQQQNTTQITVVSSTAPTATITTPPNGTTCRIGDWVPVTATATAAPGAVVTQVNFYEGTTLIGIKTSSPYSIYYNPQVAGTFAITAKAIDNSGNSGTSAPISITVVPFAPKLSGRVYFNGVGQSGVTLTLTGAENRTTVTDANGDYLFADMQPAGNYALVASKPGFTFQPATQGFAPFGPYDQQFGFYAIENTPVSVALTEPVAGSRYTAPGEITMKAEASSTAGAIVKVQFFAYSQMAGSETLLGEDTAAPYEFTWSGVASGPYLLYAKATDNTNAVNTSAQVHIDVDPGPGPVRISGVVRDGNGAAMPGITMTLSGTVAQTSITNANGSYGFYNLPAGGNYTVTAPATLPFTPPSQTFNGLLTDQEDIDFSTTAVNQPPTAAITSPSDGAVFTMPVEIPVSASAADSDGTIIRVRIFAQSATRYYGLAELVQAPYTFLWQVREPGEYALGVTAIDNSGRSTTNTIHITVNPPSGLSIGGRVVDRNSQGIAGVVMTLNGASNATAITDAQGNYAFAGLAAFTSYEVTPLNADYTFAPVKRSFLNLSANQTADFTGTLVLAPSDFDGDRQSDFAVWRPSDGSWYIRRSTGSMMSLQFGAAGGNDVLVPGNYDGDRQTDLAVWRPSDGNWYIQNSSNGTLRVEHFGAAGDKPVPGDYDGDGHTDLAVFRPANSTWYILRSSDHGFGFQQWGAAGDIPVTGDFDHDGKTDIGVWRPANGVWYVLRTSDGQIVSQPFGQNGDVPLSTDFDGDKVTDFVVFRPTNGTWHILQSSNGSYRGVQWGQNGDVAVPGDYDLDGKTDLAVFRPGDGYWYVLRSSTQTFQVQPWGLNGDVPVPSAYAPR